MLRNNSNLFIIKNGKHVHMTPDQLFNDKKFNQIHIITFTISSDFILRYLFSYKYIHIIAGMKPKNKSDIHNISNQLKKTYHVLGKINSFHTAPNNKYYSLKKNYVIRIPNNHITHTKLYLLSNTKTSATRIIKGSANLTFAGMGIDSKQNEDLTVIDNDPRAFSLGMDEYNSIAKDTYIWTPYNNHSDNLIYNLAELQIKQLQEQTNKSTKSHNSKLGTKHTHQQDLSKATYSLKHAYKKSARDWLMLGNLYSSKRKPSNKAIKCYIKGLECNEKLTDYNSYIHGKCCQQLHMLLVAQQLYSDASNFISGSSTSDKHKRAKYIISSVKADIEVENEKKYNKTLFLKQGMLAKNTDLYKHIYNTESAISLNPENTEYYNYLSKLEEKANLYNKSIFSEKMATLLSPNNKDYELRLHRLQLTYKFGISKSTPNASNALTKLNDLVGLHSVKKSIKTIINRAFIDKIRNHTKGHQQLHLVFEGNAGTGKTTVAKLLCHILYDKHVISKDKYVETSGTALIKSRYGESATLIRHMIHEAIGGVLFIDEAYHLETRKDGNDACQDEIVDELVNDIEAHKHNVVVIMAGYTQPMEHFLNYSNQGLPSRFPKSDRIIFPDYSASECWQIIQLYLKQNNMTINKNALPILHNYINKYVHKNTGKGFGNARTIRNIFSSLMNCFANRVSKNLSKHDITLLKDKSIPDKITVEDVNNLIQH